jgi:preprotein translocase subunit SecG
MKFYTVLKYVLMVLFLAIMALAVMNREDEKAPNVPNATQSQPQSKFNL